MRYHQLVAVLITVLVISLTPVFAAELNLTYDANGNLVAGDGKYRVYNSLNQLWKVYNGSTNTTLLQEYVYDPIEERVAVKRTYNSSGSTIETVYYFSEEFVRVINSSGTFDFTYVYHDGELVAQNNGSTTLFIHGNHEGSSSVVTNVSGGVVERTEYSPYGERLNSSSVRFGYEAEEYDSVVGDTDFEFRKYKQDWGLFTQPDSILSDVYDPQTLNHYAFEGNNPIKYTDPTGHYIETAIDVGFIGYDLYTIYQDPSDWKNYASLGLDLGTTALPFVAGGSLLIRGSSKIDDIADASKVADRAVDVQRAGSKNGFASDKLLKEHFEDHGAEFGFKTADEYSNAARNFAGRTGNGISSYTRPNGDIVKYGSKNNEFMVVSSKGNIRTYFKPKDGAKYYKDDRQRYNTAFQKQIDDYNKRKNQPPPKK